VTAQDAGGGREPNHARRLLIAWIVLAAIGSPLLWFLLGPQLPPGRFASAAKSQQFDNTVLTGTSYLLLILVWLLFGYALINWHYRRDRVQPDGPPMRGDARWIRLWIFKGLITVLFLSAWGSYELWPGEKGAGGGMGSFPLSFATPAAASSGHALQVQVIGQQWRWSFRYPQYGGLETDVPVLPAHRTIEFHVTSLDVIHSFSAYQLGVKADAVPGVDNVAFTTTFGPGPFMVRCYELCGLWHGHMFVRGWVVSDARFSSWIARERRQNAWATKQLPPYARVYYPQPLRRAD
jgi:cytochrome c oxidase subunit 2